MKEEWRTLVVGGKEHPWYSVSDQGRVLSHLENKSLGKKGFIKFYNPNYSKEMKATKSQKGSSSHFAMRVNLCFPDDFFEDYSYTRNGDHLNTVMRKLQVHQMVMETFRPMDKYPPERLKDCWDYIPEEGKKWIKETVYINHKDHDPSNNHVDNLEYVTPKENTHAAVQHYGGNAANKNKEEPDSIVIIEPVFDPLFQEWSPGEVQFNGKEGMELYNMLEEVAKERGKPVNDTFWSIIREHNQMTKECEIK